MKSLIHILAVSIALIPATASAYSDPSGIWTYHTQAGTDLNRIFDSKAILYMVNHAQPYNVNVPEYNIPYSVIHVYDKDYGELRTLSKASGLADNLPVTVEFNPDKNYLMAVYTDGDIDIIHADGSVVNVPGLRMASNVADKTVNSITFAPNNNRAYLATNFGYVAINDSKGEIGESRIFHRPLAAVAETGGWMVAADADGNLFKAPLSSPRMSWTDFSPISTPKPVVRLLPLGEGRTGVLAQVRSESTLYTLDASEALPALQEKRVMYNLHWNPMPGNRYYLSAGSRGVLLQSDGNIKLIFPEDPETSRKGATADGVSFWFVDDAGAFYSRCLDESNGTKWSQPTAPVAPTGPMAMQTQNILFHPSYGYLAATHGRSRLFPSQDPRPMGLSALRNGAWYQYGFSQRNPQQVEAFKDPVGIAADPDNPDIVYLGSGLHGFLRLNLADPSEVLHLSYPNPAWASLPGFVKVHDQFENWKALSAIANPVTDAAGNLWVGFNDFDNNRMELWVWDADSRRASRSPTTFRPMHRIPLKDHSVSTDPVILPLQNAALPNTVVFSTPNYGSKIDVIQHKGTLGTTSDDFVRSITLTDHSNDSDGQPLNSTLVSCLYEDTESGLVWVGTTSGVMTFSPAAVLAGNGSLTQLKVSRNDGTGLADYLLNGVVINRIVADARGRKWIATSGAGLLCVSKDGREVITSCTTDNSDIPSDIVYNLAYNPLTNSMLVATAGGMAEYQPYNVGDGTDFEHIRAYPNPVRPDYLGYVTIDGLADNSIVKIADSHGHMVRELGFAANGLIRWDVADINHRRVGSGVYFVLASTGPDDQSLSKVAKILVVN